MPQMTRVISCLHDISHDVTNTHTSHTHLISHTPALTQLLPHTSHTHLISQTPHPTQFLSHTSHTNLTHISHTTHLTHTHPILHNYSHIHLTHTSSHEHPILHNFSHIHLTQTSHTSRLLPFHVPKSYLLFYLFSFSRLLYYKLIIKHLSRSRANRRLV